MFPKTYSAIATLIAVLTIGCEEAIDWDLPGGENGRLVVRAILTDEEKVQEIQLTQSFDQLNGSVPPVSDAVVRVTANGTAISFLHDDQQPGFYRSERAFRVLEDLEYRLEVDWRNEAYRAVAELAEVAPLQAIGFQRYGDPDSLTFTNFAPVYHPDQEAMYEMTVEWNEQGSSQLRRAKMYYYTFNSLDVSGFVRPLRDTVFFPPGSVVVARKFGLGADFADYLQAMVVETEWRGGAFYSAAASLPTNISDGGLGFFAACAVEEKTLIAR